MKLLFVALYAAVVIFGTAGAIALATHNADGLGYEHARDDANWKGEE